MSSDEELQQILMDQRTDLKVPPPGGKWIFRHREQALREALKRPLIKVIMGVRRSGKSTLARLALEGRDFIYVNFDDERLAWMKTTDLQRLEKAAVTLWPETNLWLLDEIQNVPGWELFVNRLHRAGRQLVVTGSNSRLLSRELATHLTGRYIAVELFPFSFREFISAREHSVPRKVPSTAERSRMEGFLSEYAAAGGFPETVLSGMSGSWLRELHDKIVTRDIVARYRVKYPRTLKELSLHFFSNPATLTTSQGLRRHFDFKSVHTAANYVDFLEEAYLIFSVRAFSFKFREQVRQPRKIYTIDNGLTASLSTKVTRDRGALIENLVFQELRRLGAEVYHWMRPDHAVDFLIREDRRVSQLIQVAAELDTPDTVKREYSALQKSSAATRCRDLLLLTPDGSAPPARWIPKGPKVRVEALWKWLSDE